MSKRSHIEAKDPVQPAGGQGGRSPPVCSPPVCSPPAGDDGGSAPILYDFFCRASRPQQKQLLSSLLAGADEPALAATWKLAQSFGATERLLSKWQTQLSDSLLGKILVYLQDWERLVLVEQTCHRWRQASLDGQGWQQWRVTGRLATFDDLACFKQLGKSNRLDLLRCLDSRESGSYVCDDLIHIRGLLFALVEMHVTVEQWANINPQKTVKILSPRLEYLELSGDMGECASNILQPLVDCVRLHTLLIGLNAISAQLMPLAKCPSLTRVDLLCPKDVSCLEHLPATLKQLDLRLDDDRQGPWITGLTRLEYLQKLHFSWQYGTNVSEDRVQCLVKLPCVVTRHLKLLEDIIIGSECLKHMKPLAEVEMQQLFVGHLEEENDWQHLAQLANIRELVLCQSNLSRPRLEILSSMTHLHSLKLWQCQVTDDDMTSLPFRVLHKLIVDECKGIKGQCFHTLNIADLEFRRMHADSTSYLLRLPDHPSLESFLLFEGRISNQLVCYRMDWRRDRNAVDIKLCKFCAEIEKCDCCCDPSD